MLKLRAPADQIEEAKSCKNPYPSNPGTIEIGRKIFHGKAFCVTCHGKDGKGPFLATDVFIESD